VRFADIPGELVDEEGTPQAKTVFAIFYRGRSLVPKLDRICTAFGAHQHDIPNFAHEGEVTAALAETRAAISDALAWLQQERSTSSSVLRHLSLLLRKWTWGVGREKAVCHALNLAARAPERGTITAQGWALKTSVGDVKAALTDVHTAAAQGGRLQPFFFEVLWAPTPGETTPPPGLPTPPTHFKTNRITGVFQGIINTYGMPRYREANPALWTLATFPFLFGVMYGDIGHGTMLLLGAAWMVWREKEFLSKPLGA
jgi:V-type H+-transporting ATPase subunit a